MGGFRGKGKGKGGGKGGKKQKKSKGGKKDRDWAHEGAGGFLDDSGGPLAAADAAAGDGGEGPSRKRQRRMTQALQDQMRRGKEKSVARAKERAVARKFETARLAQEALWAPPPPGKPRRHRHRGKRASTAEEEARLPEAVRNQMRYRWIHQQQQQQQQQQQEGEKEEGEEEEGSPLDEADGEAAAVPKDRQQQQQRQLQQHEGSAYGALMAELAARGKEGRYRELLEQRRREEEGLSEEEEDEDSDLEEESSEGEEEEEEEAGLAGDEEGDSEGDEEGASESESESESSEDGGPGEHPADEQGLGEEENDDGDRADAFVAQWLKPPLAPEEVAALDEADGGSGGSKVRTVAAWKGSEVGEPEDEDPLLVQALGSGGGVAAVAAVAAAATDPAASPQVRKALRESWAALTAGEDGDGEEEDVPTWAEPQLAARLFPLLNSYRDVLFAGLTDANVETVERVAWLHVLNHTLKARARVLRHNLRRRREAKAARAARMAAAVDREVGAGLPSGGDDEKEEAEAAAAGGSGKAALGDSEEQDRDQGYTRPRVLVLLPMRCQALRAVQAMLALLGPTTSVSGLGRLEEGYGAPEAGDGDESGVEELRREAEGRRRKPEDWQRAFDGNCDDDFKFGVALTPGQGKGKGVGKGVAVKLFSEFYHSDIIVASPLGLRLAIEGQNGGDADFLSSIELLVLGQADVLYMQNWDHVAELLRLLNQAPTRDRGTDFARVRSYVLEGQADRFRQTLLLSRFLDPLLQAALARGCRNHRGKVRVKREVEQGASICQVALRVKQVFHRVPCPGGPAQQGDVRFAYFTQKVLPEIQRLKQAHTLVFVPSYYDFVRLRNHAVRAELSHVCLSEYERPTETSRGRARFFHGQRDLMLYTGRAHFFKRFRLRGAHHLVFYGLPEHAHFYPELVNLLEEATGGGRKGGAAAAVASTRVTSCFVMFTRYEALALERVVGTARAKHMLTSDKATFLFC